MGLEQLTQSIYQWGVDRKIIGNGTLQGQWYKLMSEYGELCDSLAKGKSPIDDIGDIYVVLVMLYGILGKELHLEPDMTDVLSADDIHEATLNLSWELTRFHPYENYFGCGAVDSLNKIADYSGLTLVQCVEHAWNDIKDRKGYLNEMGVFVKEEA